jgi:hypothetical protein
MTKRAVAVLGAALVAVGVWAGLVSASGKIPSASQTFVSKTTKSHYVDNAPKDLSAGDLLTQHSVWYRNGTKAGTMALVATVTRRTSAQTAEILYNAVTKLQDGQIALAGQLSIVPRNQTFKAAITGGTRAYRTARGYAVFHQTSANSTTVTLYLLP